MRAVASFTTHMRPVPQGSKVPGITKAGKPFLRDRAPKALKTYREHLAIDATEATTSIATGPVSVRITFRFARPKSHYTAAGELKADAPVYAHPLRRGDIDKLARAVLDALTGTAFQDDRQVIDLSARINLVGDGESTTVYVRELDG